MEEIIHILRPCPEWRKALPYTLLDSYMQVVCWVFVRMTLPYASYHTKKHSGHECNVDDGDNGEDVLAYAIESSYLFLVVGSFTAVYVPTNRVFFHNIGFTICFIVLLLAVFDAGTMWKSDAGAVAVILATGVIRFYDGWITPQNR
eukprot:UN06711